MSSDGDYGLKTAAGWPEKTSKRRASLAYATVTWYTCRPITGAVLDRAEPELLNVPETHGRCKHKHCSLLCNRSNLWCLKTCLFIAFSFKNQTSDDLNYQLSSLKGIAHSKMKLYSTPKWLLIFMSFFIMLNTKIYIFDLP